MSFSKYVIPVSKVTIDVPKISIVWLPRVSALALKSEDSMSKEKHSLRTLQCYIPGKLLSTSIVTFDTKEANFENGSRIKTPSSESLILVSFCWKKNFLRINALTNLI